jgi:hypothetical protein
MNRLMLLMLAVLWTTGVFAAGTIGNSNGSTQYCADLTNTWSKPNSIYCNGSVCGSGWQTWNITQDGSGNLSGDATNVYEPMSATYLHLYINQTPGCTANYSSYNGGGVWAVCASTKAGGTQYTLSGTFTIAVGEEGCTAAKGGPLGDNIYAQYCAIPNTDHVSGSVGEGASVANGGMKLGLVPGSTALFMYQPYSATMRTPTGDLNYDFTGRRVTEYFPADIGGPCTPSFGLSPSPPSAGDAQWFVTSPNYSVGSNAGINPDLVGLDLIGITQVEAGNSTLPCTYTNTQNMEIDCPPTGKYRGLGAPADPTPPGANHSNGIVTYHTVQFESHTNTYIIDANTFQTKRNGTASTATNGLGKFETRSEFRSGWGFIMMNGKGIFQ